MTTLPADAAGGDRHVALLRGINVGGRNRVAMAALRQVVTSLGHTGVATYVNSGNVVFTVADPTAPTSAVASGLARAVAAELGVASHVFVTTAAGWQAIVAANPWPEEASEAPTTVHAVVMPTDPSGPDVAPDLDEAVAGALERTERRGSSDRAQVVGTVVYLWTPGGLGRSVLAEELQRRRGGPSVLGRGIARNWSTVIALGQMLRSPQPG